LQEEHKSKAPKWVNCAILTVSDSRNIKTDISGSLIKELLEKNSHKIVDYAVVKDVEDLIVEKIKQLIKNESVDVIITNGGTGIGRRDVTIESVKSFFEKELISFNALFSKLSYDEIGSAAFLSRVTAGVVGGKMIFCLPGSPEAVELAMERLILPEISHVVKHLKDE
jgi:molybdenum cofactor biosynthesis protein B